MFQSFPQTYLVKSPESFYVEKSSTTPPDNFPDKQECRKLLKTQGKELRELQRVLYAHNRYAVLLVFQALDAAGKDSTIRTVLSGINPAGCQVFSFKRPSLEELDHDFLWRSSCRLPERGRIGVFNRSYYEEVLVARVHPQILDNQHLPAHQLDANFWHERYQSIVDHERHLATNGTVILKFWLNVSKEEQRQRFLRRLREPEKHWKFAEADITERGRWDDYLSAYEEAIRNTSKPWAPWYVIPADNKPFMRLTVSRIILETLQALPISYPQVDEQRAQKFIAIQRALENES